MQSTSVAKLLRVGAVWALAWGLMLKLDGEVDLANLAMLLVLASALSTLWLPISAALGLGLLAVLAFNWQFVPPRSSLAIDLHSHAILLASMLALSWLVAALTARLREQAARAQRHAEQADQLRLLGEALRDAEAPLERAEVLAAALGQLLGSEVLLLMLRDELPATNLDEATVLRGTPDADQYTGLWLCMRRGTPFGPGTGRHEDLRAWYLPMRGRKASRGAALLVLPALAEAEPALRAHAQSLCDQMGLALERYASEIAARRALAQAEAQGLRNALLAAVSHDYRTPLAVIMSAASSLQQQGERLAAAQRERLAASILDETRQLSRMTDNTLQMARLEATGVSLHLDWESAEEIVGTVLRRTRQRGPQLAERARRVRARLEPDLPLLRCDALLLTQLLDNLVDNALKYGGEGGIEILVRRDTAHLVLAVRDRGPGVPPGWRDRIFEAFQRGTAPSQEPPQRGAGVGLAACRAIARAHGGEMRVRQRSHGGASFECWLPISEVVPA